MADMTIKTALTLGGIGIVAVGAVAYTIFARPAPQEEAVTATATMIKSILSVARAEGGEAREVVSSTSVLQGDALATSHEGRGIVEMSNGSTAVLDYDSVMILEELTAQGAQTRLDLLAGGVWARVEKVFGQGEYFEIKTRNAVAVVRGTSFGLSVTPDGATTAFVTEGAVKLTPLDPATGGRLEYKALTILAGNKGSVSANGSTAQFPLKAADTSSEWFRYNNPDDISAVSDTGTIPVTPGTPTAPVTPRTPTTPTVTPPPIPVPPVSAGSVSTAGDLCAAFSETGTPTGATSALSLTSVTPSTVSQGAFGVVTLTGNGFKCVVSVTVGTKTLNGETGFVVVDNSTITFSATLVPLGTFDVVMADTLGGVAVLPRALTVTR